MEYRTVKIDWLCKINSCSAEVEQESRHEFSISNRREEIKELEVERAWARARRPGPNFWLAVNKPQAGQV